MRCHVNVTLGEPQRPEIIEPKLWVGMAWVQAMEDKPAVTPPQLRRVRRIAKQLLEQGEAMVRDEGLSVREDDALAQNGLDQSSKSALSEIKVFEHHQRELYLGINQAEKGGLIDVIRNVDSSQNDYSSKEASNRAIDDVKRWREYLPALTSLRALRFMERLGQPLLAPVSSVRRFFWRIGEIENHRDTEGNNRQINSLVAEWSEQAGMKPALLRSLLRYHSGVFPGLETDGACRKNPRCVECVFKSHCAWVRFNPEAARDDDADLLLTESTGSPLDPIRRRIVQGREHDLEPNELLATMLGSGADGRSALELAEMLIARFGGLHGLESASVEELSQIKGISEGRAVQIRSALEVGRRCARTLLQTGTAISCSEDVWNAYRHRFKTMPQEHFIILMLDVKNRVIGEHIVSKGTLSGSHAHPREVFREAIRQAANGVILMHNHPSGDPSPSSQDHGITMRLEDAGDVIGIKVLDHIILGSDDYYSFKDEG